MPNCRQPEPRVGRRALICCGFAVLLLSQLLLPFRAAARFLGLPALRADPDQGVIWHPGAPATASAPRRWKRAMLAFALFDMAVLLLLAQGGVFANAPRLAPDGSRAAAIEAIIHAAGCGPAARRE